MGAALSVNVSRLGAPRVSSPLGQRLVDSIARDVSFPGVRLSEHPHGPHRASKAYKLRSVHPEGPFSALPSILSSPRGRPWRRPCCPRSWVCPVQELDPAARRPAAASNKHEPSPALNNKNHKNKHAFKSIFQAPPGQSSFSAGWPHHPATRPPFDQASLQSTGTAAPLVPPAFTTPKSDSFGNA